MCVDAGHGMRSPLSADRSVRDGWRHEVIGVVYKNEHLFDPGQLQHTLYFVRAAHHGEVVTVAAGELVLPDELVQPGRL